MADGGGFVGTVISPCGLFRYTLERRIDMLSSLVLLVVMLNPSIADAAVDDATIRRLMGFCRAWGYGTLLVGNLFAYRSTDPDRLDASNDVVGPDNDDWLHRLASRADLIVCAWGAHSASSRREAAVCALLAKYGPMHHLGLTKCGAPRHPVRLPNTVRPQPWLSPFPGTKSPVVAHGLPDPRIMDETGHPDRR